MLGAACGDALGWPNERVGRSYVDKSKPQGPLLEFRKWTRRSGGRYYPHDEIIDAGSYSDDTQLILCLSRSLQCGPRWWDRFSRVELPFWALYERGGGGATREPWSHGRMESRPGLATRHPNDARDTSKLGERCGNAHPSTRSLQCRYFRVRLSRNIMLDGIVTHGAPTRFGRSIGLWLCALEVHTTHRPTRVRKWLMTF